MLFIRQCNKMYISRNSLIENSSLLDFFYSKWDGLKSGLKSGYLWTLACVFLWNLKFSGVCLCAAITLWGEFGGP